MPDNIPPTSPDVGRMMAEAMKAQMPSLKTQAQFTAFMVSFDAFRLLIDSIFSGNAQRETEAKDVFEKSLKAARDVTEISRKFEEVPEASRGIASNPFTKPPNEFHEYDIQKRLLIELGSIPDLPKLNEWYQATKEDRDRVVSQTLRNALIDAIREKRFALQRQETDPAPPNGD